MDVPSPKNEPVIKDADLYHAFQLMHRKDFEGARNHIHNGLKKAKQASDATLEGLYLSAMGVLHKLKNDYQGAYKFYQQAEKLLPDDSSLKIISALLLVEHFAQHDLALKKMEKLLAAESEDSAIRHRARAIQGMAYLLSGKKDKALEVLLELAHWDFGSLRFVANADLKFVGLCVKKNFALNEARVYLESLFGFAQKKKDKVYMRALQRLLASLQELSPPKS